MSACEKENSSSPSSVTCQEIESIREESKHVFKWTIRDFNCKTAKYGENFPATKFEFKFNENMIFEGQLNISGLNCFARQLNIKLKSQAHENWSVCYDIWLNGNTDNKLSYLFTQHLTSREMLLYNECCLLNEGLNTITCEIVHIEYKERTKLPPIEIEEESSLKTDLENLFNNKMFCDVTFKVGEEKIKAHKCILISRCNALASVIKQHELEESESEGCEWEISESEHIIIEGIEPKIFNEMLRYIYTDKIPKFNQTTSRLLVASEKYGLNRLKAICENELVNTITIETVSDLLILADNNNAKRLKERAIAFIKTRIEAVANTSGWQNIVKDHLHLLAELRTQIIH